MTAQTPGKIFLADQRGLTETARFRRYSTLSFGSFQHEHKAALGSLQAVNEELLAGGQVVSLAVPEPTHVLVLPITGAVAVQGPLGSSIQAEAGEMVLLALPAGSEWRFVNPYEANVVSLLHLWLRAAPLAAAPAIQTYAFTAEDMANRLAAIIPWGAAPPRFALSLGRLAGRHEARYAPAGKEALVFAFVLAGAFEIEGRLLHQHDGLALWDAGAVAIEALSNDALLLLLEVGL